MGEKKECLSLDIYVCVHILVDYVLVVKKKQIHVHRMSVCGKYNMTSVRFTA